ncbi:unnamed protein product [Mucor hiemalis]
MKCLGKGFEIELDLKLTAGDALISVLLVSQTQPVVIKLDKEIEPEVSNSIEQHIITDCADDDKAFEHGEVVENSTNHDEVFELKLLLEDWDNDFQ